MAGKRLSTVSSTSLLLENRWKAGKRSPIFWVRKYVNLFFYYMHVCLFLCVIVCTFVCWCVCKNLCHVLTYLAICMHIYIYIYTYICIWVCMYVECACILGAGRNAYIAAVLVCNVACLPTHLTHTQVCLHTQVHTCIHTYIHTYLAEYVRGCCACVRCGMPSHSFNTHTYAWMYT
jgi:hypothetical protein